MKKQSMNQRTMRIAFVVSHFPSLSETFILNQIAGLLDRGHEVDVYSEFRGDATKCIKH